jgi:cell fate regulator YaaT (PSP1 superfamily)
MVTVVGVRFKRAGKVYYFDPDVHEIEKGQAAIVETARGVEYGDVVVGPKQVPDDEIVPPLKKVIRVATEDDKAVHLENKARAVEALEICQEKVAKHGLEMKLIDVEYTFDNNKVIFYFTADGRVDFRELVKDLASVFRTRIELRQIGVRDEAKMLNGIGPCGVGLCCANWLGDFAPVSIKMAKDQNLSLNPTKISGICGRLMCCLRYEHENYVHIRKELPRKNERIMTPEGLAIVIEPVILKESVKVRLVVNEKENELGEDILIFHKDDIKSAKGCEKGGACHKNKKQPVHNDENYDESNLVAESTPQSDEALKNREADAEGSKTGDSDKDHKSKRKPNKKPRNDRSRHAKHKKPRSDRDKKDNGEGSSDHKGDKKPRFKGKRPDRQGPKPEQKKES